MKPESRNGLQSTFHLAILITHLGPGGAERVSVTLANHLIQNDWSVTLITLDSSVPDFYQIDAAINRIVVPSFGPSGSAVRALASNFSRIRFLRKTLRKLNVGTLLGMTTQCAVTAILVGAGLPVKTVAAERNYPSLLRIQPAWHWMRRLIYRYADAVVVQSEAACQWTRRYTGAKRVTVIPNPVSLPLPVASAGATPKDCIDDCQSLLLAVGRLTPQKGFMTLIEAFDALHQDFPEWTLAIIGEGPQRAELQHCIDARLLRSRVILPGTSGDISQWYSQADVFVLSSSFEGFPNVLLEAMAHGRCVVSFNCRTGPDELIDHNQNGILVEAVGNATALATALSEVMGNPAKRALLGEHAATVLNRYQPARIVQAWESVFAGD